MDERKRARRWWQFGLRDCLWLVLVAAVSAGWWAHERQQLREQRAKFDEEKRLLERTYRTNEELSFQKWIDAQY